MVKFAEKNFGSLKRSDISSQKLEKANFIGSDLRARFDNHPTAQLFILINSVALAVEGVGWSSADYWPLLISQCSKCN